uniref:Uncharacterized protein n=1 Tax=Siphoviridae sp. ctgn638 TaxID=2827913 RepID=A0A8S5TL48_9CAUD|nr:MAG TPA: Protein of unknown function (DUF2673) [Siphoviridae sp. ctgn638]
MINNKGMKNLFIILSLLILFSGSAFAVPDTITGGKITFSVYDDSYNQELWEKYNTAFWNKYKPIVTKTKDCTTYTYNYPMGAYGEEVIRPYELNKQRDYKIISNKVIKLD